MTWGQSLSAGVSIHQKGQLDLPGVLLPSLALTQIPVWVRAGREELEVLTSSPFTDGETEAMEGTLPPALPLLFLAILGLWTLLPAPTRPLPSLTVSSVPPACTPFSASSHRPAPLPPGSPY